MKYLPFFTATAVILAMIVLLFIPLSVQDPPLSARYTSASLKLTPRTSMAEENTFKASQGEQEENLQPEKELEPLHMEENSSSTQEKGDQSSDTEELSHTSGDSFSSMSDEVMKNMPSLEQKLSAAVQEKETGHISPETIAEEEQEQMFPTYYALEDITIPPVFDRSQLVSHIIYPPLAKRQGKEGLVILRLFVSENGDIDEIRIEEDPGYGFGEAARNAFLNLKGTPASFEGENVKVTFLYPVRFSLS